MLELKAFVQDSVHALDDSSLRLLSETLRVDLRGCDDRRDIERVLTGLLCLDKDTALGTFLTWLRTREAHSQTGGLVARKNAFLNTFVPVISPRKASSNNNNEPEVSNVKEHHLSEEIASRLDEIKLLEQDFKNAERHVHSGTPSFEKLKAFLVKLTQLRSKEQEVRSFLIKQSQILSAQHAQMKEETLHTRAQLDFFVDGFTNLRRRHDELVETSTHMKAENEVAQDVFLSITAQESHFSGILHRTLLRQLDEKRVLSDQLQSARDDIDRLREKQKQIEQLISRLKRERGDALKDASSYKLQLRKCKQKMARLAIDGPDSAFFRQQAIQLRATLTTLLGMFRESVVRDTKSPKQSLSKEVVKAVQSVLFATPTVATTPSAKSIRVTGAAAVEGIEQIARVVEKKEIARLDVDEVVRGVVLLGGQDGEAETTATDLCSKMRFVAVDLKQLLEQLQSNTFQASHQLTSEQVLQGSTSNATPTPTLDLPPTVENYVVPLKNALARTLVECGAKGAVLYNYELTAREANLMIGAGIPVDSIIELKVSPSPQPTTTPIPSVPATPAVVAKSSVGNRGPTSPSRGGSTASSRPTSKGSPSRQPSRQQTTEAKRIPTTGTSVASRPMTSANSPGKMLKPKLDRRAVFNSMPQAFVQLDPVAFVEDRVDQIIDQLTILKQKKQAPAVVWDETTSQVNESLLMYAEDIHMMIWTEQENRKSKKPGQDSATKPGTPSTASSSKAGSPTRPGISTTSKVPSKAPAKGKAGSPSRGSSKASSPSRPLAKASASPSKPPARSKSVSPSKPPAKPSSPAKTRASIATPSSPKRASSPMRKA